ncbi:VOC family protein [Sorangium sp. So ce1097]|uniref:VOC family protein n=1 Tax=Sorangium sp. So ce1097 TaxID=3133330 RepID=UPI003F5E669D
MTSIPRSASPVLAPFDLDDSAAGPAVRPAAPAAALDTYPLVVVPAEKLHATAAFYRRLFDMKPVFESTWFVALGRPGAAADAIGLALMAHDHPSSPPGDETFDGRGMLQTVQVADAAAAHDRARAAGVPITYPLTVEAWGQRRFQVRDPSGTAVDVVEQIAPQAGYWEAYALPAR